MKKLAAAEKAAPKATSRPVMSLEPREDHGQLTAVERLSVIANGPIGVSDEPEWNYSVENEAQGMSIIAGQLEALRGEIGVLESIMRPHMPDQLYDDSDEDCAKEAHEGFDPAHGRARTPAVTALCEVANTVVRLRRRLRFISSNVVV